MKFALFTVLLLLVSCGTSNKYIADDIYVLKPSELSIGESSADETSYSAFKKRKEGSARNEQQLYTNQYFMSSYRNCLSQPFWFNGCGCSYVFWTQNSPYSMHYGAMTFGHYQGFGYGYGPFSAMYTTVYYSPDFGVYYGSPYYNPYNGAYYTPYGYGYGYSGYGGYGYGGNGYYYGGNSTNHGLNHTNGPRGSASGFSNPNGRLSHTGPVKSGVVNKPINSHSSSAVSAKSNPVRKPISAINTTPVYRSTTTGTATTTRNSSTNTNSQSTSQGRTYQKSTAAPTRTYTPPVTRSSSPSQGNNSSGTVTRSGSSNTGNSNSGTRSSGSSSTPRSNTNTGRRP